MIKVSKVKVENNLKDSVSTAVNLIGGLKKIINRGDVVLLKPNLNTADPFPASTDVEFLKVVVDLIYDFHPKLVMIGDSSTMSLNTRKVMEEMGVFKLENMARPPRIYVFDERKWVKKEIPRGKYLKTASLSSFLDRADKLILLPCLKTHIYAQFTGALKLSVGFLKPSQRVVLHLSRLQEKIAELNQLIKPDLIIMDARKCFINEGPAEGEIREPNLILASTDRVAIDVEGIKIIQSFEGNDLKNINPWELPQIKRSIELKIGATKNDDYKLIE
ncbi:hypothetical protein AMJ50_02405 [Parcubacteria bacterium DG_74_3]|nr:MAG: hypothetical protein AMJ50_02405 [Parcubacteria bacterium DG_74_3]